MSRKGATRVAAIIAGLATSRSKEEPQELEAPIPAIAIVIWRAVSQPEKVWSRSQWPEPSLEGYLTLPLDARDALMLALESDECTGVEREAAQGAAGPRSATRRELLAAQRAAPAPPHRATPARPLAHPLRGRRADLPLRRPTGCRRTSGEPASSSRCSTVAFSLPQFFGHRPLSRTRRTCSTRTILPSSSTVKKSTRSMALRAE